MQTSSDVERTLAEWASLADEGQRESSPDSSQVDSTDVDYDANVTFLESMYPSRSRSSLKALLSEHGDDVEVVFWPRSSLLALKWRSDGLGPAPQHELLGGRDHLCSIAAVQQCQFYTAFTAQKKSPTTAKEHDYLFAHRSGASAGFSSWIDRLSSSAERQLVGHSGFHVFPYRRSPGHFARNCCFVISQEIVFLRSDARFALGHDGAQIPFRHADR